MPILQRHLIPFVVLSLMVLGNVQAQPQSPPLQAPATDVDTLATVSRYVFQLTNERRQAYDRSTLRRDPSLTRLACVHSADMLRRDFFDHVNPDGEGPSGRAARLHRRLVGGTGENIWGQNGNRSQPLSPRALADTIVTGWMNSPGHRRNILRRAFSHLGVCILRSGDQVRATQSFAGVRAFVSPPLPLSVAPRSQHPISTEPVPHHQARAERYDLWDPTTDQRIYGPAPLSDSLYIPDTTGTYRVRFYFPAPKGYRGHAGPEIRIRPTK